MKDEFKVDIMPSEKKPHDTRFHKLKHAKKLFKTPFALCVVGGIGSGKTSFVYSLLNDGYKNYFDELVVFVGTIDSNHAWSNINQKKVVVFNEWDDKAFKSYFKDLEQENEKLRSENKKEIRACVVLDDMVAEGISKKATSTALEKCLLNCRHYNLSIILLTQSIRLISRNMRINFQHTAIFRVNESELSRLAEEHSNHLTPDQFISMAKQVLLKPYNYLVVSYNEPIEKRFRETLNYPIKIKSIDI
jgi:hypothetical protein